MISVILVEPETEGNIGAIARVMKNFDFKELVLINPKADCLGREALDRATHAKDILKKAKVKDFSYLKRFDYLIGTTAMLGSDYNIPRNPLTPEQLAEKISKVNGKIGILIGREGTGLNNEEIKKCDFVVAIPTSKKYPTMNISHAVSILLYELFKRLGNGKIDDHINFATKKDKEIILRYVDKALDRMEFSTKEKKETQRIVWKRIVGKAMLTKREAFALIGFLKKL